MPKICNITTFSNPGGNRTTVERLTMKTKQMSGYSEPKISGK